MLLLFSYIILFTNLPAIQATEEGAVGDRSPPSFSVTSGSQRSVRDVGTMLLSQDPVCCSSCADISANLDITLKELHSSAPSPRDCNDLPCDSPCGVYLIKPGLDRPRPAYCQVDKHGDGWILIQRRADITPRLSFYRGWDDYKWGFGDLLGEFWWGLENIWLTTSMNDRRYELRIDMEDFKGNSLFAKYSSFKVSSEADAYRLTVTNYTGNAGDSLTYHSGSQFTTRDRDHDTHRLPTHNCGEKYKAGWWFKACHKANLNGQYLAGDHATFANGVNWRYWMAGNNKASMKGFYHSLKVVKMLIRGTDNVL